MLYKCDTMKNVCFLWLQPLITLEGIISYTFPNEGIHIITVQVAAANTILQDTKTIAVKGLCVCYSSVLEPISIITESVPHYSSISASI